MGTKKKHHLYALSARAPGESLDVHDIMTPGEEGGRWRRATKPTHTFKLLRGGNAYSPGHSNRFSEGGCKACHSAWYARALRAWETSQETSRNENKEETWFREVVVEQRR